MVDRYAITNINDAIASFNFQSNKFENEDEIEIESPSGYLVGYIDVDDEPKYVEEKHTFIDKILKSSKNQSHELKEEDIEELKEDTIKLTEENDLIENKISFIRNNYLCSICLC